MSSPHEEITTDSGIDEGPITLSWCLATITIMHCGFILHLRTCAMTSLHKPIFLL
jgi:hypothetical protein